MKNSSHKLPEALFTEKDVGKLIEAANTEALPKDRDACSQGLIIQKDNGGGAAINIYI